jgi:hypothetical protein
MTREFIGGAALIRPVSCLLVGGRRYYLSLTAYRAAFTVLRIPWCSEYTAGKEGVAPQR